MCHMWSVFPSHKQVVIVERRSQTGKALYRSVSGGWNGSEEDKSRLHKQLEVLQKDPTYLSSDATLPELNNEMAPVRHLPALTRWQFWLDEINSFLCCVSDVNHSVDECCISLHPSSVWWPPLLKLVRWWKWWESGMHSSIYLYDISSWLICNSSLESSCIFYCGWDAVTNRASRDTQEGLMWAANCVFLCSRREMMPILSLIFSALLILFGTVIIQAFR